HGGRGPERTGCKFCGGCMTGCRYGSKNTLDKNYLWLAEKMGASIRADTEVRWVKPQGPEGPARFRLEAREKTGTFRSRERSYEARNVIFAGGVFGTVQLLLRLKEDPAGLPDLSPRIGDRVRTNSEVLVGVTTQRRDLDLSEGIAITSVFQTDDHSSVQPCRYSSGSGFFRVLTTPHAPGRTFPKRLYNGLKRFLRSPARTLRALFVVDWARYTTALLYMRTLEGYLRLSPKRGLFSRFSHGLRSKTGDGPLPTASIPEATQLAEEYAEETDGYVGSLLTEALFGIPTTAHILGGACMGASEKDGVIDHQHRVFGYDGLYVIDGSAVSANPGVNPSLTITALAERAMSLIPARASVGDVE
ncbi:MAG: GMC family oxidoreductase, partial [Gemmatimonadetes bacterium]|nr:GMC family oxidoreductase [Gemmatimonadota bacterium]